ncbi:NAD(P)/FAD-dependent oxidoreductase [Paenibacillus sp. GSMTC-2017]|uniref:NAD(P)/FAD-dependent oxidoreductase n=1 Tax=Paenibacillus sp. GSMTC-2017 TaxID=2794350 RepID=UPI0018D930F6|nr:NAD(P)/FAD-dependent oxidoreductase [Paenibacillus sp. GSMTC-2017]MBH5319094.1 NAD(P)/FAD-dependent oxidoreductase [Paenibacillus sp. GSMTC-2017]
MNYDVIVVGAGSSGLMASVSAGEHGAKVLLLDKGDKLGRKLGISGGGRCNVTNAKEMDELIKNIPGNGRYLYSPLAVFNNRDIMAFFEALGIRLKEEDNGRMFPVSDKAKTVVDALVNKVRALGVDISVNSPVDKIIYENGSAVGVKLKSGKIIRAGAVIVAVGGKSVPQTGSTGDGYPWAEQAGHTIIDLFPTEVPLTSKEPFIRSKELQGLSLRSVSLSIWNAKGKKLIQHDGDMIFTHLGISGPIVLRCSQFVVKEMKQNSGKQVKATIDLSPDVSADEVYNQTLELCRNDSRKSIKNVLKGYFPEKLIPLLLEQAGLQEHVTYDNIPKQAWIELSKLSKAFPVMVNGTLSIEEAFVTGGGVNLKEIDPKSMQSKLMNNLYFCGEILDIHGYTGGYNITAAFTTGYNAGKHAAENKLT